MDPRREKTVRKHICMYLQMLAVTAFVIAGYCIMAESERLLFKDLTSG